MNSEIVDEVRKHRAEMLEAHGGDIEKLIRAMMAKQESRGHAVVTLERKEPQRGIAPNAYPLRDQA